MTKLTFEQREEIPFIEEWISKEPEEAAHEIIYLRSENARLRQGIEAMADGREEAGKHNRDTADRALCSALERARLRGMAKAREVDAILIRALLRGEGV